eukprot:scaffold19114_cov118-Isochrysis_galbana.AAC.10
MARKRERRVSLPMRRGCVGSPRAAAQRQKMSGRMGRRRPGRRHPPRRGASAGQKYTSAAPPPSRFACRRPHRRGRLLPGLVVCPRRGS